MKSHTCHNIDNTIRYTHSLHLHSISSISTHLLQVGYVNIIAIYYSLQSLLLDGDPPSPTASKRAIASLGQIKNLLKVSGNDV